MSTPAPDAATPPASAVGAAQAPATDATAPPPPSVAGAAQAPAVGTAPPPAQAPADTVAAGRRHRPGRGLRWLLGTLAALVLVLVGCELAGWPFLGGPLERALARATQREVRLGGEEEGGATRIHLFGGLRISTGRLFVGAPAWSGQPHFVDARDVRLKVPYSSLWRLRGGGRLHVDSLDVAQIDVRAERDATGRSSWQFGPQQDDAPRKAGDGGLPGFDRLHVGSGDVLYDDALLKLKLNAKVSTDEGARAGRRDGEAPAGGLKVTFEGRYDKSPVDGRLESSGALALVARDGREVPVRLALDIGRASMRFAGTATDVLSLDALTGVFKVSGPSLAATGEPFGVTLPSTGAFSLDGRLRKDDRLWNVVVDRGTVGASDLGGAFQYDRRTEVPTLKGELRGRRVLLADLAPTVGGSPGDKPAAASGRKLPQREFDIPSLRAMNANVRIDFARLELGELFARPLSPLRAHVVLDGGVLTIDRIDAATADGRLRGMLRLDGRGRPAKFETDLRLSGIDLGRWLALPARKKGDPPYLTGRLDAQAKLKGAGNSTAVLLGSADGDLRASIRNGTVSHMLVEAAGIDLAQALGVMIKGDDALRMSCAVADFAVKDGVLRPRAVLIDTRDSTITVDGTLSLAKETLDLRAVVSPKDMSPLSLRTPVLVRGTFSEPRVSLDPVPVAKKVAGGVLLGLLTPLAALLPFIDLGEEKEGTESGCASVVAKLRTGTRQPPDATPAARGSSGR